MEFTAASRSVLPLEFDAFWIAVLDLLEFPPLDTFDRSSLLVEDVGLDSLEMFTLILVIEALANASEPPADLPLLRSMGDGYDYYESIFAVPAE